METILVQIKNNKAYKLLEDLENLHFIKVINKDGQLQPKLSDKYKGIISKEQGQNLNEHIKQMRSEWNNI